MSGQSIALTQSGRGLILPVTILCHTGDCGGGAVCGEILDIETGKVISEFPNAYQLGSGDGNYYDASFRPDSRLLVVSGVAADPEVDREGDPLSAISRTRYFELKDDRLVLIKVENN
ncbi:hypothetical protein [Pseudomonas nicosulfuronedens]